MGIEAFPKQAENKLVLLSKTVHELGKAFIIPVGLSTMTIFFLITLKSGVSSQIENSLYWIE